MRRTPAALRAAIASMMLTAGAAGCRPSPPPPLAFEAVEEEVTTWREWRHEDLMKAGSWLSLTGLFWLEEGTHTFGSAADNDLVFPGEGVPDRLGTVQLSEGLFDFSIDPSASVLHADTTVTVITLEPNEGAEALTAGSLTWYPVLRDGRFAIRLTDTEAPTRTGFTGVESFPISTEYRITGRFVEYETPDTLEFPSVYGGIERMESAGEVHLEIEGHPVRLRVEGGPGRPRYRATFADLTNGVETYGGGRYVWFDAADEDGWITVDFNQSYNPPCVFTDYSTCALPPRDQHIPARIAAGELGYGKYAAAANSNH